MYVELYSIPGLKGQSLKAVIAADSIRNYSLYSIAGLNPVAVGVVLSLKPNVLWLTSACSLTNYVTLTMQALTPFVFLFLPGEDVYSHFILFFQKAVKAS